LLLPKYSAQLKKLTPREAPAARYTLFVYSIVQPAGGLLAASVAWSMARRANMLLLLVLRSGGSTAAAEGISVGCADLVVDCGAVPDDATDSAAAFYRCMALASQRSGCVTIPGGSYRISPVQFNQSNLEFTVANRAVFRPHSESSTGGGALFTFGEHAPTSANYITNVSLHGLAPGRFIVDVSEPLRKPWRVRAVAFAGINGFALANVLAKMSPPDSRSELPDGDGRSQWYDLPTRFLPPTTAFAAFPDQRLNFNTARAHSPAFSFDYSKFTDGESIVRLNPQGGVVSNISSTGAFAGYGLVQLRSGKDIRFKNLWGEGGVTLRLETGDDGRGYAGNISGSNITCVNGSSAFMAQPHCQANGEFHVTDLVSIACNNAMHLSGGFVSLDKCCDNTTGTPSDCLPAGHYDNSSSISRVRAVYGTAAQVEDSSRTALPSCAACAIENAALNYNVRISDVQTVGFPPPSQRDACTFYRRCDGCYFENGKSGRDYCKKPCGCPFYEQPDHPSLMPIKSDDTTLKGRGSSE
jgi:hypothetical protein